MEFSSIGWTDHTANFWWGCTKVHAGCQNCYAEATDNRYGGKHWGAKATRRAIASVWNDLAKWNEKALEQCVVHNVFACSMCDLFEEFTGNVVNTQGGILSDDGVGAIRDRALTYMTHLDGLRFLVLTKRPENIIQMVPASWLENWPKNVWTGTSPCDQKTADESIHRLLRVPGHHFLSCEPLLGPVNLRRVKDVTGFVDAFDGRGHDGSVEGEYYKDDSSIGTVDWVIIGGESVGGRPCKLGDVLEIVQQCSAANVPVFVKQIGSNPVVTINGVPFTQKTKHRKGEDINEFPVDLQVRQFPASFKKNS